ncbi:thioredoxin [Actinomycetospora sp. NBRC 106378]|uniref:thioredoxin n=1 Tax=Actinomycetospora sp. NBRC 106378 TaxID=3032208 RepID=UPI0024A096DC|nr:thioredoxin [Actinomycetospora sp. NBRC 106378]GLZ55577.1 thiol reductase thioredoxin [Actinomycetospora sp. NBRC 106378]
MTAGAVRSAVVTCPNCSTRNRVPAVGDGRPTCGNCHAHLPWIAEAGDADFAEVAERAPTPVLVDLWATWCGPCRMVSPALEQLATERAGRIKLVKVDVDANQEVARRFEIMAVPTLLVLSGGEVVARQAGAAPLPALRAWLDGAPGVDVGEAAATRPSTEA